MTEKVVDLKDYLLTHEVDLNQHKPHTFEDADALEKVIQAWTSGEEGIKIAIENRMQRIKDDLIYGCTPYEVLPKREALAELATLLSDFTDAVQEGKRRDEEKKNRDEQATEDEETPPEEEPAEDNTAM